MLDTTASDAYADELDRHRDELLVAGRAGLDELAEELLFFGSRPQTVS